MIPQSPHCQGCLSRQLAELVAQWIACFEPAEQSRLFHEIRDMAARWNREQEEAKRMGFVRTENGDAHVTRTEGEE